MFYFCSTDCQKRFEEQPGSYTGKTNKRLAHVAHPGMLFWTQCRENPFQDPLRFERRVPECAVVIFGANGDLTKRKLMPALYRLAYDRRLSAGFAVIGISRTP